MEKEITFSLSEPVKYGDKKGELQAGTFLTLLPPTSKNMAECAALKQAFFRALPKDGQMDTDTDVSDNDAKVTGDAVMTMIAMSKDVELASVLVVGRELLTSGVALVEGEVKLTKPIADTMTQDDLEGAIGEYIATFIIASALQKAKKSSSKS